MGDYGNNAKQDGDVLMYQSDNYGDITAEDGIIAMTSDFDTMAYLTLFGGNDDDPGGYDKSRQYWGNFSEPDMVKHYRGEFQYLLESIPATSGNLTLLQDAATRDFERAFVDTKIANSVTVTATIPAFGQISVLIEIDAYGSKSQFKFTENWESTI